MLLIEMYDEIISRSIFWIVLRASERSENVYPVSTERNLVLSTEFIAPQLAAITEGIVKGSEQNLSRAMFKIAVELGALTHMLAAMNDVDDATLYKLRLMCSDEVKRINGIINFEKAVRYQRSD